MTLVDSKTCPKLWEEKRWSLDRSLKDWTGCHGGSPSSYVQSSVVKIILVPFLFFRVCCPLSVALIFVVFLPIRLFSFVISSVLRFHGLLGDRFFLVCFKSSKLQCFFCSKPDLHGFPMDLWVPDVSSCASGPDKRPSATTARHRTKQSFPTKTRQKSRFVKIYRPQIAWKVISHFRGFLLMQKKTFFNLYKQKYKYNTFKKQK